MRKTGDGTQIFSTPGPSYKDNSLDRAAELTLDPDGKVHWNYTRDDDRS